MLNTTFRNLTPHSLGQVERKSTSRRMFDLEWLNAIWADESLIQIGFVYGGEEAEMTASIHLPGNPDRYHTPEELNNAIRLFSTLELPMLIGSSPQSVMAELNPKSYRRAIAQGNLTHFSRTEYACLGDEFHYFDWHGLFVTLHARADNLLRIYLDDYTALRSFWLHHASPPPSSNEQSYAGEIGGTPLDVFAGYGPLVLLS